jgi:hypothetical protein
MLRVRWKPGAPGVHLLSALAHRVAVPLAQHAVADKTNTIAAVTELLRQRVLEGCVVTVETLLTQRAIASQMVEADGNYMMYIKANHPQYREEIAKVLAHTPREDETRTVAETVAVGHGWIAQRYLQTSDVLAS